MNIVTLVTYNLPPLYKDQYHSVFVRQMGQQVHLNPVSCLSECHYEYSDVETPLLIWRIFSFTIVDLKVCIFSLPTRSRDSSVGIATGYRLDDQGEREFESR
jgi:hypothetical protein